MSRFHRRLRAKMQDPEFAADIQEARAEIAYDQQRHEAQARGNPFMPAFDELTPEQRAHWLALWQRLGQDNERRNDDGC